MKKNYLLLLLLFFFVQYISAQFTIETFENSTAGSASFTSGSPTAATFNLTNTYSGGFTVKDMPSLGYNSSNRYIQVADDVNQLSIGQSGFITITSGTFRVSNLWIYLSSNSGQNPGVTFDGLAGSVIFIGKLGGVTQFSVTKDTDGTDIGVTAPEKGFIQADFATLGGTNNTSVMIDQLEIKLSSNYGYFAIDDFAFEAQVSAPTITTTATTAANIGAVRASLGGNVTAGTPLAAKGIVWSTAATTTNPTLANNVVINAGTATGIYSDFATGLTPSTLIYYRAYATNSIGTSYGAVHSFTTNAALGATQSQTDVSFNEGSNGTATVTPSGGKTPYTYSWSPSGGTGATASGLGAGQYAVTITDGDLSTLTKTIDIGQPAAVLDGTPSSIPVSCFGGGNGSATIAPNGGTPGYTYAWSNGATSATASNLMAGTYSVTITDANSSQRTITGIVVEQPLAPLNGTPSVTTVSCNGGANGSASITPVGGTPGYTYLWSNGATSQTITGLSAGVYSVTITDAKGCSRTINNIMLSQPSAISPNPTQTNVSCFNGTNGTATVAPIGGAGVYTYLWAHSGSTNASVSGLTAGTYTVKITDANACERDQSFTITQPPEILVAVNINNVSCFNGSNGTATVNATGGAGSFTYSWSPTGGTAATASGLTAGTYTVTVIDANACQVTQSFTIMQPAAIVLTPGNVNNVRCHNGSNGTATVNATGGAGSFTYSWSPTGGTAATASGLTAGTYTVTVIDANACQATQSFTIMQPATPLTASQGAILNVACHGDTTGSASVNVTGGTGNYTYSWAPSGGTAATATGLAAGTYTVTVTDGSLCQTTQTFTITQPFAALAATTASTGVSCFGGSNGSASVTASNGTFPYTYSWAPLGGTSSFISGKPAGNYTCTITDANGCFVVKPITISTPLQFSATVSKTDVSCNGGSNGSATITPAGATAPFTYTWSPTGGSSATASGLSAGTYSVIVQDANTCQYTVSVTIVEPAVLTATSSQINVSCPGGNNGEASVIAMGGTAPYTYIWSPVGGTAATATGLTAGNYSVLISDSKGCFTTRSFTIINTPDNSAPVPNTMTLPDITGYCSIFSSEITVPTAVDNCAGTINATTTDPLNYTATGNYSITWTYDDGNGNITTQTQNVIVLDSPLDALTFTDKTVTYNGNVQTIELGNLPSDAIVTYSITPATTTPNGAIDAGNYTVTALVFPGVSAPNCVPVILSAELSITKATQQITFAALEDKTFGVNNTFALNAAANSALPISYSYTYTTALPAATVSSSGSVELLRSGEITITASQAGNDNYLAAESVSQILYVKNNDVAVSSITIGGTVYTNVPKEIKYVMECDENSFPVAIANQSNATITPAPNFTITPPKPGIYSENVEITSQDGSTSSNYTIIIEKPFSFFDIVHKKFNNVMFVNNNPETNGGYTFDSYEWFKNGVLVGTGQYYSAGENITDELDNTANYEVKMKTKEGQILQTCKTTVELQKSVQAKIYPNPIQTGKVITVEADFPKEELEKMNISLFSMSGQLIEKVQSSSVMTQIQLPNAIASNVYLIVIETANIKKTLKLIVDK